MSLDILTAVSRVYVGNTLSTGLPAADIIAVTSKEILVLALFAGAALSAFAAEGGGPVQVKTAGRVIESLPLHLELASMKKAKAPEVIEGELVLSVSGPYRSVAAAFEHEGFAQLHAYEKNRQGVFVLAYPIPLKRSAAIEYRIIVDGAWMADPAAPERKIDQSSGLELSVAHVPYLSDLHMGKYQLLADDGRTARFLFRGESGESVTVCGDFDNWDPFLLEMSETSPGVYELSLPLSPGRHYYNFIYRGEALTDPLNPQKAANREGKVVSVLKAGSID
jgi:hypothetical protein